MKRKTTGMKLETEKERRKLAAMADDMKFGEKEVGAELVRMRKLAKSFADAADDHKIKVIIEAAMIEARALKAGNEKLVIKLLMEKLKRRKYAGGQSIKQLVMQSVFKVPAATASRYTHIVRYAIAKGFHVRDVGDFVEKEGGWQTAAQNASARFADKGDNGGGRQASIRVLASRAVKEGLTRLVTGKGTVFVVAALERGKTSVTIKLITDGGSFVVPYLQSMKYSGSLQVKSAGALDLVPNIGF